MSVAKPGAFSCLFSSSSFRSWLSEVSATPVTPVTAKERANAIGAEALAGRGPSREAIMAPRQARRVESQDLQASAAAGAAREASLVSSTLSSHPSRDVTRADGVTPTPSPAASCQTSPVSATSALRVPSDIALALSRLSLAGIPEAPENAAESAAGTNKLSMSAAAGGDTDDDSLCIRLIKEQYPEDDLTLKPLMRDEQTTMSITPAALLWVIKHHPSLKTLHMSAGKLCDKELRCLEGLKDLEVLRLDGSFRLTPQLLSYLVLCQKMRHIIINDAYQFTVRGAKETRLTDNSYTMIDFLMTRIPSLRSVACNGVLVYRPGTQIIKAKANGADIIDPNGITFCVVHDNHVLWKSKDGTEEVVSNDQDVDAKKDPDLMLPDEEMRELLESLDDFYDHFPAPLP